MSLDTGAMLIVGVPFYDVIKEESRSLVETRYDNKTGEPYDHTTTESIWILNGKEYPGRLDAVVALEQLTQAYIHSTGQGHDDDLVGAAVDSPAGGWGISCGNTEGHSLTDLSVIMDAVKAKLVSVGCQTDPLVYVQCWVSV